MTLNFPVLDTGPALMVVDALQCFRDLAARGLTREEVIGTPLAGRTFAVVDAIWEQDLRIGEVTGHPWAAAG